MCTCSPNIFLISLSLVHIYILNDDLAFRVRLDVLLSASEQPRCISRLIGIISIGILTFKSYSFVDILLVDSG